MNSVHDNQSSQVERHHNRTKSSGLRSFIHKRTHSKGEALSSRPDPDIFTTPSAMDTYTDVSFLPKDHPHARALGELQQNHQSPASSPKKSRDGGRPKVGEENGKSLHKKTLSSISLKTLAGRDGEKADKHKEEKPHKAKKSKSSTNLAALLSRPRSTRNLKKAAEEELRAMRDQENMTPQSSSPIETNSRPPIYAQFSSQSFTTQPLGGKFLENEIDLYTPQQYSPERQRNFHEGQGVQPTLARREDTRRPISTYLPSSFVVPNISTDNFARRSCDVSREEAPRFRPGLERKTTLPEGKEEMTLSKRGGRVMAAVASFGTKSKPTEAKVDPVLEMRDVDTEFEAMLDRRNIPENQRHKMRSLTITMKIDFIKQDWAEIAALRNERPGTDSSAESAGGVTNASTESDVKVKRPRGRTFTLSRSSKEITSPTKKIRPEATLGNHNRSKSTDSTSSHTRSLTSSSVSVANTLIAKAKGQLPDDFVLYLRKVQKPEAVEVGRLHKLRLLLRNETVAWTDTFIGLGGMKEIVGLLHRTMEVEWREEHEDALLHEVLLCLKALCTTALAQQHLNEIQNTLFPSIIHMLFDEEKKGPSEFTTRNIITSLLFTYLKSAPMAERPQRAQILLGHLRDPEPKEDDRPVNFVLEMRRDRPYRVWCKEVVNVTKEVFWIFLHNLNVVALPDTRYQDQDYQITHFPQELPPVAAAPYVGGVEWDATNYLASHLDLINGILSSIPTSTERNALREQLNISGWERCMGGTMRLCKEKFYGGVHAGLRCWVAAALEDGWNINDVRNGPRVESRSPVRKSPSKKAELAPKIEMPKLDFGFEKETGGRGEDSWL